MDNCPIHDIAMFAGKFGPVHKTDDPNFPKGWCNGKPKTDFNAVWNNRKSDFVKSLGKEEEKPDWDAKERRMVRMNVLNRAVEIVLAQNNLDLKEQLKDIATLTDALERLIYKEKEEVQDDKDNA